MKFKAEQIKAAIKKSKNTRVIVKGMKTNYTLKNVIDRGGFWSGTDVDTGTELSFDISSVIDLTEVTHVSQKSKMNFRDFVNEKQPTIKKGTKVFENGYEVGTVTKVEINPKGYGNVYHVIDSDKQKWTFNDGHIKSFSGNKVEVLT